MEITTTLHVLMTRGYLAQNCDLFATDTSEKDHGTIQIFLSSNSLAIFHGDLARGARSPGGRRCDLEVDDSVETAGFISPRAGFLRPPCFLIAFPETK